MLVQDDAGFFASHSGGTGAIWLVHAFVTDDETRAAAFSTKQKGELWLKVIGCDKALFIPLLVDEPDYLQKKLN